MINVAAVIEKRATKRTNDSLRGSTLLFSTWQDNWYQFGWAAIRPAILFWPVIDRRFESPSQIQRSAVFARVWYPSMRWQVLGFANQLWTKSREPEIEATTPLRNCNSGRCSVATQLAILESSDRIDTNHLTSEQAPMTFSAQDIKAAQRHLRKNDETMKEIMRRVGPFTLKPQRERFNILVRSIVSQQISTAAAKTILGRLQDAVGSTKIKPEMLEGMDVEQLREVGISRQKATYLLDLRDKCTDGTVKLAKFTKLDDELIIAELTQIKGIGRWTAEMFLIFCLGRLNVFPYDDLGIRSAMARAYGMEEHPTRDKANDISQGWHPYCTVASWYLWRSLEVE